MKSFYPPSLAQRIAENRSFGAEMARHGRGRWALLVRPGAMIVQPPKRSGWITCNGQRSCATPHGRLSSRFRRCSGYPSIVLLPSHALIATLGSYQGHGDAKLPKQVTPVFERILGLVP